MRAGAAEEHPLPGTGQIQPLLGPGEGHIAQPSLLLHLLRVADGSHSREDSLLHAHHETPPGIPAPWLRAWSSSPLRPRPGHGCPGRYTGRSHPKSPARDGSPSAFVQIPLDGGQQLPHVLQPGAALHHRFWRSSIAGVAGPGHHLLVKGGQLHRPGQRGQLALSLPRSWFSFAAAFCSSG